MENISKICLVLKERNVFIWLDINYICVYFKRDAESTLTALLITVVDNALLSKYSGLLGCDPVSGTKGLSTFRSITPPLSLRFQGP